VDGSEADVDVIVCATGYRFEMPFLPAGIPRARQGYPLAVRGECAGWQGLFVLGTPCAVRADSQFIHGVVADAHVVANSIAKRLREDEGRVAHARDIVEAGGSADRVAPVRSPDCVV
jgi:hypothetical protein